MININVSGKLISGSYGREQFVVRYTKERYDKMMEIKKDADKAEDLTALQNYYSEFAGYTKETAKEMVETICPYIYQDDLTEEFFLKSEDVISSIPIPQVLVDRILESAEKGIDFEPLVKLWIRWLRNPKLRRGTKQQRLAFSDLFANYISTFFVNVEKTRELMDDQGLAEEVAIKLSSVSDVSVTQEGLLCTYKVVNELSEYTSYDEEGKFVSSREIHNKETDNETGLSVTEQPKLNEGRVFEPCMMRDRGDAIYIEGANGYPNREHKVKIGCVHRLPDWSYVNTDDSVSCVKGLHTGSLTYVKGWQSCGSETLDVLLDPMHIGAVANGDNALRVLQYFVHGAWTGTNGSIYHSSTYAAQTDEEWDRMRKEVVEYFAREREKVIEAQDEEIAEIEAI